MVKYSRMVNEVLDIEDARKGGAKIQEKKKLRRAIEEKIEKLEEFTNLEELELEKKKLERARLYIVEERKWINEVVSRIDIVPEESNYYDKLAVKPGFEFFQVLISVKDRLDRL